MKHPKNNRSKKNQSGSEFFAKLSQLGSLNKNTDRTNQKRLDRRGGIGSTVVMGGLSEIQRIWVLFGIMAVLLVALFIRALWVQVINRDWYLQKADELRFFTLRQNIPVQRGMILDTKGLPLAGTARMVTVSFSPYDYAHAYYTNKRELEFAQNDRTRQKYTQAIERMNLTPLAQLSGIPKETLDEWVKLDDTFDVKKRQTEFNQSLTNLLKAQKLSRHTVLLQNVTPEIAQQVLDLKIKGITSENLDRRFYLQPEPNAPLLGYMTFHEKKVPNKKAKNGFSIIKEYKGTSGIEKTYDERLAGKSGQKLMLAGNKGAIEEIKEIRPAVAGETLNLTLDSRLQYVLYKELVELGRIQSARWASGMVVDVKTGDVLAMSSWPSFNANNLNELKEGEGFNERNRPVMDVLEPGSVMKPFTVVAALESGKYNVNTLIHTSPGSLTMTGRTIKDSANYGSITMAKLIQKSSNVASAKIALSLPPNAMSDIQKRFGFGQTTNLNLMNESAGKIQDSAKSASLRASMAYGYGQEVTLAQIAQAYATLGNGGVMRPLRLIKNDPIPKPVRIISETHAKTVVSMMQSVTENGGTAPLASISGYHVAGKTGTSRRARKNGYIEGEYRNIFAGVAPATNPRFAVVILVEDPKAQKYAGQTVAPVFANVMKETLRLYNVPFDKPLEPTQK